MIGIRGYSLLWLLLIARGSMGEDDTSTYTAAVVEFNPAETITGTTPDERLAKRVTRIDAHIRAHANLDIIVFPENAICESVAQAMTVPAVNETIVPCSAEAYADTALQKISCAALAMNTYVVINVMSKQACVAAHGTACPDSGFNVYNTNVVFDRKGTVISTYRKFNVYYEPGVNSTVEPDLDTFTTDFDVRFGHTICFDLMFEQPSVTLVRNGVRNILHPTWWFSELPALTAVQTQQAWSQANDVNLLAAGIAAPSAGSSGTGIYSGVQGALGALISSANADEAGDSVIVRKVPKVPLAAGGTTVQGEETTAVDLNVPPVTSVKMLRENLDTFTWRPVNVSEEAVEHQLCNDENEFCCTFRHKLVDLGATADKVAYDYIAAVHKGNRTFGTGKTNYTVFSCSVIACHDNSDLKTCATLHVASLYQRYKFAELSIGGVLSSNDSLVMPSTLTPSLLPLSASMYDWSVAAASSSGDNNVTMSLKNYDTILLNFGVYGREFRSAAQSNAATVGWLVAAFVVVRLCA